MCRVVSCVVGRGCLLWLVHSLGKTISLSLLHFVLEDQTILLLQVSLDFLLLHSSPLWWKGLFFFFFGCQIYKFLQVFIELFSFFGISGWGIDVDYCDAEWLALEMNQDYSFIFEIVPKYCISDSFVDYEDYSFSCKEFLPTVVDTVVIWIKFAHSCPF